MFERTVYEVYGTKQQKDPFGERKGWEFIGYSTGKIEDIKEYYRLKNWPYVKIEIMPIVSMKNSIIKKHNRLLQEKADYKTKINNCEQQIRDAKKHCHELEDKIKEFEEEHNMTR